jgi:cytochrome c556
MRFSRIAAASLIIVLGVTTAVAADEGTKPAREAMMKTIGSSVGVMAAMAKGDKPYDAETVKSALMKISETAKAFPDQFKPGSDKTDKAASPKIWENAADFKAHADKLSADADIIVSQMPADPAALGTSLKVLGADCSACHQAYRLKE